MLLMLPSLWLRIVRKPCGIRIVAVLLLLQRLTIYPGDTLNINTNAGHGIPESIFMFALY